MLSKIKLQKCSAVEFLEPAEPDLRCLKSELFDFIKSNSKIHAIDLSSYDHKLSILQEQITILATTNQTTSNLKLSHLSDITDHLDDRIKMLEDRLTSHHIYLLDAVEMFNCRCAPDLAPF